jgi:hypothetical protein
MLLAVIVVLSVSVLAADPLCSDTDGGGDSQSDKSAIETKGEVKYGITTQVDTCLTAEEGVSASSGKWLKEYFCRDDKRDSNAYDCVKLGYEKCEAGECVKPGTGVNATPVPTPEASTCGNKIVEKAKGEQCDPPNNICFGKSTAEYGTCQADCTCKISEAALKNMREQPAVCGDKFKHPDEDCEEDSDCTLKSYICSSCKCVKQLTPEEIERMKQEALAKKEEQKEEVKEEIEDKYAVSPPPDVDLSMKNFSEEPGIKATSGIANFFRKIFGWIAGLFS